MARCLALLARDAVAVMALGAVVLLAVPSSGSRAGYEEGKRAFRAGNFKGALAEWRPLAAAGNSDAQYALGTAFTKGQGVPKDRKKGLEWYRKAANQGHAEAQHMVALAHILGKAVK
jgi:TPR repeat protein